MKPCRPERPITCAFKQKGDWWATGEHSGIDYGCPTGDPVYAMWGGTVTGASWGSAYGTHIVIDHDKLPNGDPGLWAIYAHLKSKTVSNGQRVYAGELIGYSDNTGNSSGPHLHVEVQPQAHWVQGSYRNPQPWIDAGETMNYDYDYLGKPSGTLTVGRSYARLDDSEWDPPHAGWEHTYVYLNIKPTFQGDKRYGALRIRIVRADGDATGHEDMQISRDALDGDGVTLRHIVYWEEGDGKKTHVELKCIGGLESVKIGTRYTKKAVVRE